MSKVHKSRNTNGISTTMLTYGLLTAAGAISMCLPGSFPATHASPTASAEQIRIYGVVRDFAKGNASFKTAPAAGNGHYANNIGYTLGADDRPVFTGAGFKVSAQWHDKNSRQIAPHLF